jgi:dihydrofolate reductase
MGRIVYDTATSLDGRIADESNSLDWLFAVEHDGLPEEGLVPPAATVLVEGSTTYEWVLAQEDLLAKPEKWKTFYQDRPTFVFTTRELPVPEGADVRFVSGPVAAALPEIRAAAGDGDIWVVGGGDLAGQFLDVGALDEIALSMVPVTLTAGATLLPRRVGSDRLRLVSANAVGQFARLVYEVQPGASEETGSP